MAVQRFEMTIWNVEKSVWIENHFKIIKILCIEQIYLFIQWENIV